MGESTDLNKTIVVECCGDTLLLSEAIPDSEGDYWCKGCMSEAIKAQKNISPDL